MGGIIGSEYKTSLWHSNGFPEGSNIGSIVQYRGETLRYVVHLKYQTKPQQHNIENTLILIQYLVYNNRMYAPQKEGGLKIL